MNTSILLFPLLLSVGAARSVSAQCDPLNPPPGSPFSLDASGVQEIVDSFGEPMQGPAQGYLNLIVTQNGSTPCQMSMELVNYDIAMSTAAFGTIRFQLNPTYPLMQNTIIANQPGSPLPATATISAYLQVWIFGHLFQSQGPVTLVSNSVRSFPLVNEPFRLASRVVFKTSTDPYFFTLYSASVVLSSP